MTIEERLRTLQKMTSAELKAEWRSVLGEEPRSGNLPWLRKRLAWAIQAQAYGGLSEAAKQRIEELLPQALAWMPLGRRAFPTETAVVSPVERGRLKAGTTITRVYKQKTIVVNVREDGFEYEETIYRSLTAVAKAVTGSHWNGNLFFGLSRRKDDAPSA